MMFKVKDLSIAGIAALVLAAGSAASAQEEVEEQDAIEEIVVRGTSQDRYNSSTTTIGRSLQDVMDIPKTVSVIPEQVLIDQQVYDYMDALRNVSGLVANDGFGGSLTDYSLRGFRRGEFYRNGVAMRSGGLPLPSAQNIESIEVIKGPASVTYGKLSPGGLVNIVTKKPSFSSRGYAQASFDEYGKKVGTIDLTGPLGGSDKLAFRFNGLLERSETFIDFHEVERDFVSPSLLWMPTAETKLTLTYEYANTIVPVDRGWAAMPDGMGGLALPEGVPVSRNFGEAFASMNLKSHTAEAILEQLLWDDWYATATVVYFTFDQDDAYVETLDIDQDGNMVRRLGGNEDQGEETYIASAWLNGALETGSINHQLTVGMDYRTFDQSWTNFRGPAVSGFNIFDPVYGLISESQRDPALDFDGLGRDERTFGAYIQDQIFLTEKVSVLLGGRYDSIKFTDFTFRPLGDRDAFTPEAAVLYQPTENTSLYASYSDGWIPTLRFNTLTGEGFDPERGEQYEIGAKGGFFDGRVTVSGAVYELTKDNIVAAGPVSGDLELVGEVRSRGFEVNVAGQVLPGWNVFGSYAYLDNEILTETSPDRGNRAVGVADHVFRLWNSYEVREGRFAGLGAGIGVDYTSDRPANNANNVWLGDYFLVDLGLWYYIDGSRFGIGDRNQIRLGLNVKNLTDERYFAGAGRETRINVGHPRTVIGSVALSF